MQTVHKAICASHPLSAKNLDTTVVARASYCLRLSCASGDAAGKAHAEDAQEGWDCCHRNQSLQADLPAAAAILLLQQRSLNDVSPGVPSQSRSGAPQDPAVHAGLHDQLFIA